VITRRELLIGAAALAGCRGGPSLPAPNIIILAPDQLRGVALSDAQVQTPHIDRLAAEGVTLRNCFANCPASSPARASLLTGQYAHTHGVEVDDAPLSDGAVTLAEIFQEQGYRTGFVGNWRLQGGVREPGFVPPGPRRQGFDFWAARITSHDYWRMRYYRDEPEPIEVSGYSAIAFTDEAIGFVAEQNDSPFLLFVEWGPPHDPYVAPPEYMNIYEPDGLAMRENWVDDVRDGLRNDVAGYYAAITFIDNEIGRLLEALASSGKAENTIVLLTSDHGDMLGSQGLSSKHKPWEESIRVPGILRYPAGIEARSGDDALFSHIDVAPTLLGLAGVPTPQTMEGRDLSSLVLRPEHGGRSADERAELQSPVYLQSCSATSPEHDAPWRGVRTERYTYVRRAEAPWLLYDNQEDPYQLNNLVGKPQHSETEAELDRLTLERFEHTGDDWTERPELPYR